MASRSRSNIEITICLDDTGPIVLARLQSWDHDLSEDQIRLVDSVASHILGQCVCTDDTMNRRVYRVVPILKQRDGDASELTDVAWRRERGRLASEAVGRSPTPSESTDI